MFHRNLSYRFSFTRGNQCLIGTSISHVNSLVYCGCGQWLRNFLACHSVQLLCSMGSLAKLECTLFSDQFNKLLGFLTPIKGWTGGSKTRAVNECYYSVWFLETYVALFLCCACGNYLKCAVLWVQDFFSQAFLCFVGLQLPKISACLDSAPSCV